MLSVVALLAVSLLSGCEPEPLPTIDEVDWSSSTGTAVIRLAEGVILLDGKQVGDLREPGVLRQSRHRKLLKALKLRSGQDPDSHDPPEQALLSHGWPVRLELVSADAWDDVYPLIATAAWAGFGPFELTEQGEGGRSVGPLATDTQQPAGWRSEPILGVEPVLALVLGPTEACASVRFEVQIEPVGEGLFAGTRQLPQVLRSIGNKPLVDCSVVYAQEPRLQAICLWAQQPDDSLADPPPAIPKGQRGIPARPLEGVPGGRTILAPVQETPVSSLMDAAAAATAAGASPVIALTKPGPAEDMVCPAAKVLTLEGVHEAGARWLGEHLQDNR